MNPLPSRPPESLAQQVLRARARLPTPLGEMTALVTDDGLAALLFDSDRYHQDHHVEVALNPEHPHISATRRWLDTYWSDASPSAPVPLDLAGTPFQRAVWQVLLSIPFGATQSYGEVARQVGPKAAARATGGAVGRNPVAVMVPCHRVIGANHSLTGYASGLPKKIKLLQHEGAQLTLAGVQSQNR